MRKHLYFLTVVGIMVASLFMWTKVLESIIRMTGHYTSVEMYIGVAFLSVATTAGYCVIEAVRK